jgi:transposase
LLEGRQAEAVLADKGYDSDQIVAKVQSLGAVAVIPSRRHRKQPRTYDRELYKQRNRIERCFNRLKHFRRFSTRYC